MRQRNMNRRVEEWFLHTVVRRVPRKNRRKKNSLKRFQHGSPKKHAGCVGEQEGRIQRAQQGLGILSIFSSAPETQPRKKNKIKLPMALLYFDQSLKVIVIRCFMYSI